MDVNLAEAHDLADKLRNELNGYPDLFYTGYTQDALKEFVEANVTAPLYRATATFSSSDTSNRWSPVASISFGAGWGHSNTIAVVNR